jgi:hypothetical protein
MSYYFSLIKINYQLISIDQDTVSILKKYLIQMLIFFFYFKQKKSQECKTKLMYTNKILNKKYYFHTE